MSLAIRISGYVNMSFLKNPNGLSLKDIEKTVESYEKNYFDESGTQMCLVDCMRFMEKPRIEQKDITKFFSINKISPFWEFSDGKYFLVNNDEYNLDEKEKNVLVEIRKNPKKVKKYRERALMWMNIVEMLTNSPEGVNFDDLYAGFRSFSKQFKLNEPLEEYGLSEDHFIEDSFIDLMHFDSADPYNSVYIDKKDDSSSSRTFAYEYFTDWEYKNGLYHPTDEWIEKNKEKIKKYGSIISSNNKLEDKTLLNQINQYCILSGKTNNDFLRMHLFMQANLDNSRK